MIYTLDNPKLVDCFCCFQDKETFTGIAKNKNNDIAYYLNGKCHREDGPACEFADGDKQWWLNGTLHRTDGPAIERGNGDKGWYLNGKRHREDGPSLELFDGYKSWYLNDKFYGCNDDYTNESWIRFTKLRLLK